MNNKNQHQFGNNLETIMYPALLLILMWSFYLLERISTFDFYKWGIFPKDLLGLRGIIFSPLLHSPSDFGHILNNSGPIAILFGALIYFYRQIAAQIFFYSWFVTGLFVWVFAINTGSYHIGMSSVIYALAGFLFVSGTIRKYRPLQGISLFVIFVYGSLIWGIFPMQAKVSWEGHLAGLITGVTLAFLYKSKGPQAPKYQYEIEKEMGIEPPDLEGQWLENIRLANERAEEIKRQQEDFKIIYDYISSQESIPNSPLDEKNLPSDPDL
jgi:membrane associated rhomboid family serine protease